MLVCFKKFDFGVKFLLNFQSKVFQEEFPVFIFKHHVEASSMLIVSIVEETYGINLYLNFGRY